MRLAVEHDIYHKWAKTKSIEHQKATHELAYCSVITANSDNAGLVVNHYTSLHFNDKSDQSHQLD